MQCAPQHAEVAPPSVLQAETAGEQRLATPTEAQAGSGWGGTWIPTDDFMEKRRKPQWPSNEQPLPPRVYVDNMSLIREVSDVRSLRRGDHCLIAINVVRAVHPMVDKLVSLMGSIELVHFYHHFIMVDDVSYLDEAGVPRNAEGQPAMIFECANTVPEAWTEVKTNSQGRWHMFPLIIARFILFSKTKCTTHALADYGDTPNIYLMLDNQSSEEREQTVQRALQLSAHHDRYHVVLNNCEHTSNLAKQGNHRSPLVEFACWSAFRLSLGGIGLMALQLNQDMFRYHFFTLLPVALQSAISYGLIWRSVKKQREEALIDKEECYHLLSKEFGRAVVVGGMAVGAMYSAPQLFSNGLMRFAVCTTAYAASDALFNCLAHGVMRLVLLPSFGKVWLLGSSLKEKSE